MTFAPPCVLGGIIGPLGWPEIIGILLLVTLLFGAKKLPELARGFGKSIREFKKATSELDADERPEVEATAPKNGTSKPEAAADAAAKK